MIRRSTWIVLAVFLVLVGAVLIFQKVQKPDSSIDSADLVGDLQSSAPIEALFHIPEGDFILGLRVEDTTGRNLEIKRDNESATWVLVSPEGSADQDTINRVLMQLESVSIDQTLSPEIDREVIGLSNPAYTIALEISNGGVFTVFVGNITITNTSYYAQLAGDPPIVVNKFGLDPVINMLDSPPVLVIPTPTVDTAVSE